MPLIPRQVLYGNPERAEAAISPDGERLGYLAPVDGVLNVWVGSRDGEDFSQSPTTPTAACGGGRGRTTTAT